MRVRLIAVAACVLLAVARGRLQQRQRSGVLDDGSHDGRIPPWLPPEEISGEEGRP